MIVLEIVGAGIALVVVVALIGLLILGTRDWSH